jgi:hypothetical protein
MDTAAIRNKKVFLVTSGDYSDYRIYGAFSTNKLARAFIADAKAANRGNDYSDDAAEQIYTGECYWAAGANVEEWVIDEMVKARVYSSWSCGMLLDDGSLKEPVREGKTFGIPAPAHQFASKVPAYGNKDLVRVTSIKSAAHALKLCAEKRQEWLRTRAQGLEHPEAK